MKRTTEINRSQIIDAEEDTINPATEEKQDDTISKLTDIETNQTDKTQFTKITDGTNDATVNSEGRQDVVQHSHIDQGTTHMHIDGLSAGTTRYIIVDISDTTNWPHSNTLYGHLEWFEIEVDGTAAAEWQVNLGFLEDVTSTDSTRYVVKHWSGTRTAGQSIREFYDPYPNGQRMRNESIATHMINLNDTNYQDDVLMFTTLSPTVANVFPGDGDIIIEIIVGAGEIDVSIELGYHAHA